MRALYSASKVERWVGSAFLLRRNIFSDEQLGFLLYRPIGGGIVLGLAHLPRRGGRLIHRCDTLVVVIGAWHGRSRAWSAHIAALGRDFCLAQLLVGLVDIALAGLVAVCSALIGVSITL